MKDLTTFLASAPIEDLVLISNATKTQLEQVNQMSEITTPAEEPVAETPVEATETPEETENMTVATEDAPVEETTIEAEAQAEAEVAVETPAEETVVTEAADEAVTIEAEAEAEAEVPETEAAEVTTPDIDTRIAEVRDRFNTDLDDLKVEYEGKIALLQSSLEAKDTELTTALTAISSKDTTIATMQTLVIEAKDDVLTNEVLASASELVEIPDGTTFASMAPDTFLKVVRFAESQGKVFQSGNAGAKEVERAPVTGKKDNHKPTNFGFLTKVTTNNNNE